MENFYSPKNIYGLLQQLNWAAEERCFIHPVYWAGYWEFCDVHVKFTESSELD